MNKFFSADPRFAAAVLLISLPAWGQGTGPVSFSRSSGGSMESVLLGILTKNPESTLNREWITAHDPSMSANIIGTVGVKTTSERSRVGSSPTLYYSAEFSVEMKTAITAIEIRFILFDLWGNTLKTLRMNEVFDLGAGVKKQFTGTWRLPSENELSEFYASLAFVSRVRTAEGRVIEANLVPIVEEAKKFSKKFSMDDIEQKPTRP